MTEERYPCDATAHAHRRANREQRDMAIYGRDIPGQGWTRYVRPVGDPAPEGAELVKIVKPEGKTDDEV